MFLGSSIPVFSTIDCLSAPLYRSNDDELQQMRLVGSFAIPPSYREWIQTFGYGETFKILLLRVPLPNGHCDSLPEFSAGTKKFLREGVAKRYFEYEPDGSPELVERLVPFGISIDGHCFAWDFGAPTAGGEYAVYAIGSKMLSVVRAGDSFVDFIEGCCDSRLRRTLGAYPPLPRTFKPRELRW